MKSSMKPAGYAIIDRDHSAIWATGESEGAAWANLVSEMALAGVTVVDGDADEKYETSISGYLIFPATAALIERVENCGGNLALGYIDGVLCTREEEDAAP